MKAVKLIVLLFLLIPLVLKAQCFSKISCSGIIVYAIKQDNTLWYWGGGTGNNGPNIPTQIGTETNWINIANSNGHRLAIKNNGTLWAKGGNTFGQLGTGSTILQPEFIQVGMETNWQEISCGTNHSIAIKSDGTLWAWGRNDYGQIGDGTVVNKNSPIQIGTETNWIKIYTSLFSSFAIKSDGTLWSWGLNDYGQLGINSNSNSLIPLQVGIDSNWVKISTGFFYHTLGLKSDGSIWSFGLNNFGQLGDGTTINKSTPSQIGNDLNWIEISGGGSFSFGIKNNGTLWAWGKNDSGQLGDGTYLQRLTPSLANTDNDWQTVNSGRDFTNAQKVNGSLYSWGYNFSGQLGIGSYISQNIPTLTNSCTLANDQFNFNKLTIYPNPTKSTINITSTTAIQKTIIYNLLGAKVYEQAFSESIDISSLSSGVYVVKFYGEDNVVFVEKIVKE